MKTTFKVTAFLLLFPLWSQAQLILSEISPTNAFTLPDENNDFPDWIEIFNPGPAPQNLLGFSLSDTKEPKWTFPDHTLSAGDRVLVFASGKNRGGFNHSRLDHWETALNDGDYWRLFVGTENPPADWTSISFDDATWTSAQGGFGYGDNDDVTIIPDDTPSFYYRQRFSVTDPSKLDSAILSMDYDDGFIAYINGIEVARSSNMPDGAIDFMTVTTTDHEASLYNGGLPEAFQFSKTDLSTLLVTGQNVLAVEIHNVTPPSSDLTGRSWLHFGINTADVFYGPNPPFFNDLLVTNYHTNFKIGFGETIYLFGPNGESVDSTIIPYLLPSHSIMRIDDTGSWCLTDSLTPAEANGNNCRPGYTGKPVISPLAGFYQTSQTISIAGTNVRYTTDGSEPSEISTTYSGPFQVSSTAVIRARSFDTNLLAGPTASATYFINETRELPVLSITARPGDLFYLGDGGLAVYDNYNSGLRAPAHLEYFDKNNNLVFAENASLRPVGGYSIAFDQKSMQFAFDEDFGAVDEVQYPIFGRDKPGITSYREFRVRNMDDDWNSTRIRDVLANQLTLQTHCASTGYQHMAVFINGEYWGHYGGREVTNEYYVRDNHGADPDKVDEILTSYFQDEKYYVDEGTGDDFFDMSDFIIQNDMSDSANFAAAKKRIDWENWVDYFAAQMHLANGDWFSSVYFNNTRLYRTPDVRWRFVLFDVTYSQGHGVSENTNILYEALANPAYPNRYTNMMNSLLENPGFRRYFINRFADLINEYWTPSKAGALIEANAAEIASEINRQSARWGSLDSTTWRSHLHDLDEFHVVRRVYQRQHIEDYFQLQKQVDVTLRVEPAGAGVIHINSIIPKNYPWAGVYFDGNPVTITAVANPGYTFDHWVDNQSVDTLARSFTMNLTSASSFTAHFAGAPKPPALELTEINYHPDPTRNHGDWFEIRNAGDFPIDLTQYKMQDRDWFNAYPVPAGTILQPGGRLVVTEDDEQFTVAHPSVLNKTSRPGFALDNSGDEIRVYDRSGNVVIHATYDDDAPWPCTPDGKGRTLERLPDSNDPNQPASWFDGCIGGSPGAAYSLCGYDIMVSEINYNSSSDHAAGDWFEIKNQLLSPVDLSGWSVRDDNDEHIFTIPDGMLLESGGYLVLCENKSAFSLLHAGVSQRIGDLGFGLNNAGDVIRLYDAGGLIVLSICFDDSAPWVTEADGEGYTLELEDPSANLNDPSNWFAGCPGGSPGGPYDPDCIQVDVSAPASSGVMAVSPNPFDGALTIRCEEETTGEIQVVDIYGKIILQEAFTAPSTTIWTGAWRPGIYLLILKSNGLNMVQKVIKQ